MAMLCWSQLNDLTCHFNHVYRMLSFLIYQEMCYLGDLRSFYGHAILVLPNDLTFCLHGPLSDCISMSDAKNSWRTHPFC